MRSMMMTALLACALPAAAQAPASPAPTRVAQPLPSLPYTPSLHLPSMDRSVDPCVDFYAFSCGGWIRNNPIPGDKSRWSVYGKLYDENTQFLWGLLQEAAKPAPGRSAASQKTGDYFASCMDEAAVEAAGLTPLKADLDAIAALASKDALPPLLGRLHPAMTTAGMLFGIGSEQDARNSSSVIAVAYVGGLGLPDRDYYVKDDERSKEIRARYLQHVAAMLTLAGLDKAEAKQDAETVMRIETALAKASLTRVEQRDPYRTYHKQPIADLQRLTPGFDWTAYLKAIGLPSVTELNVTQPKFFEALQALLAAEPLAAWKTYLRWHLLAEKAPYLTAAMAQESFDFNSAYMRGTKEMPARWKRCVELVDRDLGEALGQVFVEKAFPPEVKAATVAMTVHVQKAMETRLLDLDWMGDLTRKQALTKLGTMKNKVGYPDVWRDYAAFEVKRGALLQNVDRGVTFETRRQFAKIGKPVDRGEWGMTPPSVNAYYNASMNDMNFPAGILLPPLFDPKMDAAPNYGNTGSTIGHELTHGFDDEGRKFDSEGNLRDWWTEADGKEFENRASCVADQYAQYVVIDDVKINSRLTLGEDVADLGGTILAYEGWRLATASQRLAPVDGLTPDQRFFVGFAQWACADERPESKRLNAATDPHSPPKYRINGVVVNMPEFADAFSCKPGQPMVKAEKDVCRVW